MGCARFGNETLAPNVSIFLKSSEVRDLKAAMILTLSSDSGRFEKPQF
jgi:hypothetical protein